MLRILGALGLFMLSCFEIKAEHDSRSEITWSSMTNGFLVGYKLFGQGVMRNPIVIVYVMETNGARINIPDPYDAVGFDCPDLKKTKEGLKYGKSAKRTKAARRPNKWVQNA